MVQIEVISGVERRRRWSDEQKRAIVAAAFAPGAVVTEVARRADINTGLLYRWRRELCAAPAGFAEVMVRPLTRSASLPSAVVDPVDRGMVEVRSDGGQARLPLSTPPELAAAVVRALVRR